MKTKKILSLAVIVCCAACGGGGGSDNNGSDNLSNDACGVLGLKIIDGAQCNEQNSPVVDYRVQYLTGDVSACTGTMVTSTKVLTAGHCFPPELQSLIAAVLVQVNGNVLQASNYIVHPGYQEASDVIHNDVALITLPQAVSLPTVPIFLSEAVVVGDVISIFGYGLDEHGNAGDLRSGQMQVDQVSGDNIISIFNGDGSNTCQGDSGGPAVLSVNGKTGLVGVTSAGIASAVCQVGDVSTFANLQDQDILNFVDQQAPGTGAI